MPKNNMKEDVTNSVSSLYKTLINKRKKEQEEKEQQLVDENVEENIDDVEEEVIKMSKKERREKELENWKSVITNLIGDELDYVESKTKKKKYRKWIDDSETNRVIDVKQKKIKKKNYHKEFEPELNMLRSLVADQNKFNIDLQKRFNNAAGPASKDGMIPNKTMVELASAIVSGRSNSLGILREIGSLKKNIADLTMKQKKLSYELKGEGGGSSDNGDLMLMGSNIMASIDDALFNPPQTQNIQQTTNYQQAPNYQTQVQAESKPIIYKNNTYGYEQVENATPSVPSTFNSQPTIEEFDPSTWSMVDILPDKQVMYETIPKTIVVEKNTNSGNLRFKAIRNDNGEEIKDYPGLPDIDPNSLTVNEKDGVVRGVFDETYRLVES